MSVERGARSEAHTWTGKEPILLELVLIHFFQGLQELRIDLLLDSIIQLSRNLLLLVLLEQLKELALIPVRAGGQKQFVARGNSLISTRMQNGAGEERGHYFMFHKLIIFQFLSK